MHIVLLLALLGVASPLHGQALAPRPAGQRPFVEGGMVAGGAQPSEVLLGAAGEFGVPVWQGLVDNSPHSRSLRVRVETLSGNGEDVRLVSVLFAEAVQFNPRLALEAAVGYGTSWGALGTTHGLVLGVGLPITLANRLAIVPRFGGHLLFAGEVGLASVATLSLNLRLRL